MSENNRIKFEKNTEFFLLLSYSALPTVLSQLVNLEKEGKKAVLFCYTSQLNRLLSPLMQAFAWIKVIYIDNSEIDVSLFRPWEIWKARKILAATYQRWFSIIPSGSIVHFYNHLFAFQASLMIWKLRNSCVIHYTDCDPIGLLYERDQRLYSRIKLAFLSMIYQMPIQMASRKNDPRKPIPSLSPSFFEKTVKVTDPKVVDLQPFHQSSIYRSLCWKSDARVLWVMGVEKNIGWGEAFGKMAEVVNSFFSANEQAIKYHPRWHGKYAWAASIECLPDYVPIEFVDLPRLEVVLAIASSSVTIFPPKVKVVGLINLLPYKSQAEQQIYRDTSLYYAANLNWFFPSSLEDLRSILKNTAV